MFICPVVDYVDTAILLMMGGKISGRQPTAATTSNRRMKWKRARTQLANGHMHFCVCNEWVHKAAMTYVHTPPVQPCSQIKSWFNFRLYIIDSLRMYDWVLFIRSSVPSPQGHSKCLLPNKWPKGKNFSEGNEGTHYLWQISFLFLDAWLQ